MNDRINQTILSCLILLFIGISIINAQEKKDWLQVYADKYFFSYEYAEKSVIVYACRDTMIEVWIDGVRDAAKYRKDRYCDSFEREDNGVGYFLERTNSGYLYVFNNELLHGLTMCPRQI